MLAKKGGRHYKVQLFKGQVLSFGFKVRKYLKRGSTMRKVLSISILSAFLLMFLLGGATYEQPSPAQTQTPPTKPSAAQPQPPGPCQPIPVGILPSAQALGDFNKDAIPDLAVANSSSNDASILLGKGDGCTFDVKTVKDVGIGPRAIAVGDFDTNGCQDLALANEFSKDVMILLGKCDGSFTKKPGPKVGDGPIAISVGDFNRDGHQDLAMVDQISDDVFILLGDNKGNFAVSKILTVGDRPNSITVGDFNRDGLQDLVVTNDLDDNISILIGVDDGTFKEQKTHKVGLNPSAVAASYGWGWLSLTFPYLLEVIQADFNRDGIQDLVVANRGSNDISVLLGKGDGAFEPQRRFKTDGNGPSSVAVGDFNRDAIQDLAVTNQDSNTLSILLGKGDGNFVLNYKYPEDKEDKNLVDDPTAIVIGDFNRNGCQDLAVANRHSDFPQESSNVVILLGNCDGSFAFVKKK